MKRLIVPASIALVALTLPALAAPKPISEPSSLSILGAGAAALGGMQIFRRGKRKPRDEDKQ